MGLCGEAACGLPFTGPVCFKAGSTNDLPKHLVEDWSEEDVSVWLRAQGLEDLVSIFRVNNIDGKELLHLTKESLAGDLKIGKARGELVERAVLRFL